MLVALWSGAAFYLGWQSPELFGNRFEREKQAAPSLRFYPLKRIVISVPGKDYSHYVLLEMAIKSSTDNAVPVLEEADVLIKNTLMKLFSRKSIDYLNDPQQVEPLQLEVKSALLNVLSENHYKLNIEQVLFTRMVVQ